MNILFILENGKKKMAQLFKAWENFKANHLTSRNEREEKRKKEKWNVEEKIEMFKAFKSKGRQNIFFYLNHLCSTLWFDFIAVFLPKPFTLYSIESNAKYNLKLTKWKTYGKYTSWIKPTLFKQSIYICI